MKKRRLTFCLLLSFVFLLSACTPVSKMETLSTAETDYEVLKYGSEDLVAFPSAKLTFLESGKDSSAIFYCRIKWTNESEEILSFNEMFPIFKGEQVKEPNDPNALPLDLLELPDAEKKIPPQKSQSLILRFKLENQKDKVYLTFGTIDGFEKHYDVHI